MSVAPLGSTADSVSDTSELSEVAAGPTISPMLHDTTDNFVLTDVLSDPIITPLLHDTTDNFVLTDVLSDPIISPLLHDTTDIFVLTGVFCDPIISPLLHDTTDTFVLTDVLRDPNISPLLNDSTDTFVLTDVLRDPNILLLHVAQHRPVVIGLACFLILLVSTVLLLHAFLLCFRSFHRLTCTLPQQTCQQGCGHSHPRCMGTNKNYLFCKEPLG